MRSILQLTPLDPLIARDGRPFGEGQGNRMRGLPWPLASVVAGSFRTALVKAGGGDFSGDMPRTLLEKVSVAGVFPVHEQQLYLPSPLDAAAEPIVDAIGIKAVRPVRPEPSIGCCDFPNDYPLRPVLLPKEMGDCKPVTLPTWWPIAHYNNWMMNSSIALDDTFLMHAQTSYRDHVKMEADSGAAMEGQIFSTAILSVTHLRRYRSQTNVNSDLSFCKKYAAITLSARVQIEEPSLNHTSMNFWHPLGGERRLVHWKECPSIVTGWECPQDVKQALRTIKKIRMVLATPAIFSDGWKPGWLNDKLEGTPPGCTAKLKLVGVINGRWKAVSGWSLAATKNQPRGPKPIRRMVPAGSVYFFEVEQSGDAAPLIDLWLQSVSDGSQDQRDGFGLATWGIW